MNFKSQNKSKIIISLIAAIIVSIIAFFAIANYKKVTLLNTKNLDAETLRAMTYAEFTEDDKKTDSENVEFSAFFTRDLDQDGYAEKIKGTCKHVENTDTLYAEINVRSEGYLKDGQIILTANNFSWTTSLITDEIVNGNYIGITNNIKLQEKVYAGSQKLFWGTIDAKINRDSTAYSQVNSIRLIGTYVDDEGLETPIDKTIDLTVDWYTTVKTDLRTYSQAYNLPEVVNDEEVAFDFYIINEETYRNILLKDNIITATIPELKGYKPIRVELTSSNGKYEYDEETGVFTITNSSTVDENGYVKSMISRYNRYDITVYYPKEAYEQEQVDTVVLEIPVTAHHIGYNNSNSEFSNPLSSKMQEGIISLTYSNPKEDIYDFSVCIGEYKYDRTIASYEYIISKKLPLKLYNGIYENVVKDTYIVRWDFKVNNYDIVNSAVMKETVDNYSDKFKNVYGNYYSMEDYTSNIGVYFEHAQTALGKDGYINVYNDETNELVHTFTVEDWGKYTKSNPYKYATPIKHIRVETSKVNPNSLFKVYNVKQIDDAKLVSNFSLEEFDKLSEVSTYLTGGIKFEGDDEIVSSVDKIAIAGYENEISVVDFYISSSKVSVTDEEKSTTLTIKTTSNYYNESKWKNSEFLIKLPPQIISAEIKNITVNNSRVEIMANEVYQKDGCYFIKVITSNEQAVVYDLKINLKYYLDITTVTQSEEIELYAYNEENSIYEYSYFDVYDVNGNNNKNERVGYRYNYFNFVAPSTIVTNQVATNYDSKGSITVSPNIAEVKKEQRTANINVNVINNYSSTISQIYVLGGIPYEGNTYIFSGKDLGSEFTTQMTAPGITIPEELEEKVTIYYTTNASATKDLQNEDNMWTTTPEDWSQVKRYLIDFGDNAIPARTSYTFTYEIYIPEGIDYNKQSFSSHAVYFALDTAEGKLISQTEPAKLGVKVTEKYNIEVQKYKIGTSLLVPGATYSIKEYDENGENVRERLITTDENGKLLATGLYVERTYILKEIKSPDNYVLNDDEIEFKVVENDEGVLEVIISSEDNFANTATIEQNAQGEYVLKAKVEDEAKYDIVLTKTDGTSGEKLQGVVYKLIDGTKETSYVTNADGQINIEGLVLGTTYKLTETKAYDYYVYGDVIEFVVQKNAEGVLEIVTEDDEMKNAVIVDNELEDTAKINVSFTNEKIPTYSLELLKVSKGDDSNTGLTGAIYKITSTDTGEVAEYKTDENGIITIDKLYQYVDGKYITGEYTIEETISPEGYALNTEKVVLKSQIIEGVLTVTIQNQGNLETYKNVSVDGNKVKLILQDKPLFKLTKVDEFGNKLEGTKFIVYSIALNRDVLGYAKDVNGNYIGEKDLSGRYIIKTDSNGEIILALPGGYYKIVEIETGEEYYLSDNVNDRTEYFKVEGNTTISNIEELIDFSKEVSEGKTFEGQTVYLLNNLDFNNDDSYLDPNNTSYGDINGNSVVEGLKRELTTASQVQTISIGTDKNRFKGIFEGNGKTISNFKSNSGIFNYIENAEIVNLGILNCELSSKMNRDNMAGIINYAYNSKIEKCYTSGTMSYANSAGGLICYANDTKISNCYNTINSTNAGNAGGIVYQGKNVNITNCYNSGRFENFAYSGGIIGQSDNCYVYNVYNTGYVKGAVTGGIIGRTLENTSGTRILNSYNTGEILCNGGAVGGILGENYANSTWIENCYNEGSVSHTGGSQIAGILGRTTQSVDIRNCRNSGDLTSKSSFFMAGIIAEGSSYSTIYTCFNEGNIISEQNCVMVGGIAAYFYGHINNCINTGNIQVQTSQHAVGGILGAKQSSCRIDNCTNVGDIVMSNSGVWCGGIVGDGLGVNIYNSCNIGDVTVTATANGVGGIVGNPYYVENVYNAGKIFGGGSITGLYSTSNRFINCYYLEGSADATVGNNPGNYDISSIATSKTESEIKGSLINTLQANRPSMGEFWNTGVSTRYGTYTFDNYPFPVGNIPDYYVQPVYVYPSGTNIKYNEITELTVTNTMKRFNITTEIAENSKSERAGGTITGSYNEDTYLEADHIQFVEEVIYGNASLIPIQIIPAPNYIITKITINSEEIDFVADDNGEVTLNIFEDVIENKHIIVTFEKDMSRVIVHHYLKDENGVYTTNKVADDQTCTGQIDDQYVTSPRTGLVKLDLEKDADGNYVLPANAKGTITKETQEVTYYYEPVPVKLTVHHYLNGTEDSLAEDENYEYPSSVTFDAEGNYTVSANGSYDVSESPNYASLLNKYELVKITSTDKEDVLLEDILTITDNSEVIYYYELKEFNITTEVKTHTELRTNEYTNEKEEIVVKGGEISGENKNPYEIVQYEKDSTKELIVTPESDEYVVKTITLVSTDEQGNQSTTIVYGEGKDENAEITYTENEDGTITLSNFEKVVENKHIIVEFKAILGTVIVHHYVEGTGEEFGTDAVKVPMKDGSVGEDETKQDYIGEIYATKQKENISDIYELKSTSGQTSGKYINGVLNVYYYYNYKNYEYTVEYYYENTDTNEFELAEEETEKYEAQYGTEITTYEEKLKDGYILDRKENLPLTVTEVIENNVIKVYYGLIDCQYTVEYYYENKETYNFEIDDTATVIGSAEFKDVIVNYTDKKKTGYVLDHEENLPLTISTDESKNIIKVYYALQDYNYTVNYYYDNVKDDTLTENKTAEYLDVISTYTDNSKDGYLLVTEQNVPLTITEKEEDNVINIYYETAYKITTSVVEHTENYKDGSSKTVTGGTISGMDKNYLEQVVKGESNKEKIDIIPTTGYEIVKVTINGEDYNFADTITNSGSLTIPVGYFPNVQEDIHVEVEFRKTTKVIVKYLEKDTEVELAEQDTINGYEGKAFETTRKPVTYYQPAKDLPISDENKNVVSDKGNMFADTLTIIYWYEKVESRVVVRHIEVDEKGNETEIESETVSGFAGENANTSRKTYEGYINVNGTAQDNENIVIAKSTENTITVELAEDIIKEVWYYYEKQFEITTEAKNYTQIVDGVETQVKVGEISGEGQTPYEYVLNRAASSKEIQITPYAKYKVKSITVNGEIITIEENADHSVTIPKGYFDDVQENIHVVAEFEKIPTKVVVKYVYKQTGEEILPPKTITGVIDDKYEVEREEIENYLPLLPDPENATGVMTEQDIEVIFYYTKQFAITTDVIEYEEKDKQTITLPKSEEIQMPTVNTVKGGKISGEDEAPYELVYAGEASTKDIEIVPDEGYEIVMIRVNGVEQDLTTLDKHEGTVRLELFTSVIEDKHVEVQFAKIPARIVVKYLDEETDEPVATEERATGNMCDKFNVFAKEIPGYKLVKVPEITSGVLEKDIVLVYYYKKIEVQKPEDEKPEDGKPEEDYKENTENEDENEEIGGAENQPQAGNDIEIDNNITNNEQIEGVQTGDNIGGVVAMLIGSILGLFIPGKKRK